MIEPASKSIACLALALGVTLSLAGCGGGDEPASDTPEHKAELQAMSSAYVNYTLDSIQSNGEAMALAGQLFQAHCAGCHGADGRGAKGITDLTRGRFNFGTSADAIRTTIREGRRNEMPSLGHEYGELELGQIVAFVETLSGDAPLSDYERHGRELYLETCAACHGEDGRGQAELGAANLTDDYWQNGESMMNMRLAITRGVVSVCPAQGADLTPIEIDLLTAYTLNLIDN
jgi:cytochrome c oxidase cbb3-type subunit 3